MFQFDLYSCCEFSPKVVLKHIDDWFGLLEAHYSPNAKIILNGLPKPGDGFIALSDIPTPAGTIRLASPKDDNEYAHELYNALRLADIKEIKTVQVIPPIEQGVGVAINNRLIKAAYK
jgi:L-threonylcarbamoyladenylate synthase